MSKSTRARGLRRVLLGLAAGAMLLVGTNATPAGADEYGTNGPGVGHLPDDRIEDYCFSGSMWDVDWTYGGLTKDAVLYAMQRLDGQTNMSIRGKTSCSDSTDIWFMIDTNIGERGNSVCVRTLSGGRCDRFFVTFNPFVIRDQIDDGHEDEWFYKNLVKTACHEVGHSVGLKHDDFVEGTDNDYDCMRSGDVGWWDWWQVTEYNAHHVWHINSGVKAYS